MKSCWFVLAKGHSSPRHEARNGDCRVFIHQSPSMCNPILNTRPCVLVMLQPNLTHFPLVPHICVGELGHLFGTKPLSKPMLVHCQFDTRNKLQLILITIQNFHSQKCIWNNHLRNGGQFGQRGGLRDRACDKDSLLHYMLNHRFILCNWKIKLYLRNI